MTLFLLYIYRAIDGAINSDAMATVHVEETSFLLEALRYGEFYCMVVRMCEGKISYLGTQLHFLFFDIFLFS